MNFNKILEANNVDAIWVTNTLNKRYITEFTGSTCEVIIIKDEVLFFTDGRYTTQIKTQLDPTIKAEIITSAGGYFAKVLSVLSKYNNIGIEGQHLSVKQYNTLVKELPNANIKPLDRVFENLRICKTKKEIELTKKAVAITDKVFSYVIENIKPGMSEMEVKLMVEAQHFLNGAEALSFDPIVAAGKNAAKPHASPSDYIIQDGDILTIDNGCSYQGYASDMTRTFFVGKPKSEELVKIHQIVLDTMQMQIKAIGPGVACSEIDKIGRDYITAQGYGPLFMHGTGHGTGLDVHEDPYVNQSSKDILKPGMIITIEPGIYIEGLGGVRIEQDVVVTEDGYDELNQSNTSANVYNELNK